MAFPLLDVLLSAACGGVVNLVQRRDRAAFALGLPFGARRV